MVNSQSINFDIIKITLYKLLLENMMKYGFSSILIKFMAGVIFIQIDFFFFGFYTSKIIIDVFSTMKFEKKGQIDHSNIHIHILGCPIAGRHFQKKSIHSIFFNFQKIGTECLEC